ncbi:7172_t:CDS:2 [Rhizophagus irregularis]|nr:7172_t:CDS:2 [Rhizophagus irregularis]
MSDYSDIRVVVGLDFGTTYSGFTYCHISDGDNLVSNDQWPGEMGHLKTNTKAITDYLRKIGELIKEMVASGINFLENVLIVITVPAEYLEKDKAIMRKCAYNAELIKERYSKNLQFTTEPEAAAVYCMENNLKVTDLNTPETTFMIVDCGGGTVDLTTRKLLKDKQLGEVTERAGDFCGSTFIDREFLNALRKILGDCAIDLLEDNHYGQMQYMIQEFCLNI